ncbi:hypothetical protein L6452_33538 [Arctium lappa]|uniref:Uncharacterized protein n=1 Tax=Arctium lappa TaxID=4217 RepID=A0ACB8YGC8_ARCLA|nr:hypothetical protein L6452_33538 [Arctium lappa]
MAWQTQGVCIEEEKKALLEIKASLIDDSYHIDPSLLTWVDDVGRSGGECCDWERVTCNTTTGHIMYLSLSNMMGMVDDWWIVQPCERTWPLNVSLFLHFKELTGLNLSFNCLDTNIVSTGLDRLSGLEKLEILDLSSNSIENGAFSSLGVLTSLRVLNLGYNHLEGYFPALALENLEILELYGNTFMQGFERVSLLKKLKILNLADNNFNESQFITSLSALPLLKTLDLSNNGLTGSFPAAVLAHMTNLEELDLSYNRFNETPTKTDNLTYYKFSTECMGLSRLKKMKSMALKSNSLSKSIFSCLSALPSLKTLHLSFNPAFGSGSFLIQELAALKELETLDLSYCQLMSSLRLNEMSQLPNLRVLLLTGNNFNGTLSMEALTSFHHLEVLDLSKNFFVGSIPSTIHTLSSLRVVSFAHNILNGSLPDHGLCELKNLHKLDLSHNMFDGSLPQCFSNLSSLKLLDISSNRFTGELLPSLIANLTSLEYIDFSENKIEGSFSFSSLSNHTKLEVFISKNNKLEVDTEEPIGWIPKFQLEVLVLSSCNINRHKGSVLPGFLLHQHKLQVLDLSHNSLVGQFPNWLIENNTVLKSLNIRNNSFSGIICMPLYRNANTRLLDISENHMIGTIPSDIQKILPYINFLNLSGNSLDGLIPSSIADLSELWALDLSDNELSGEVPKGLFTNISILNILKLSKNRLHGSVLSGNLSFVSIAWLGLDNNCFTGKIGNGTIVESFLQNLDISHNFFTGTVPHWISNIHLSELAMSNNGFKGRFPCGIASFSFLDISQNSFSGPIPYCLNLENMKHLRLGSNKFTGSIPNVFRNLTSVLTLDIGNNLLSGRIPGFLGELSDLSIVILRKNNFSGSIPKQLCQLNNMSLIDLSSNSLSGSIPRCLQNIVSHIYPTFIAKTTRSWGDTFYHYDKPQYEGASVGFTWEAFDLPNVVQFTTKSFFQPYKGRLLDLMVGLDLSCNKLTGEIPKELGLLNQIHSLNLSHNQLFGPIPVNFSNLVNIESLDLSSNNLSGEVPSELIELNSLAVFNVSHNNLSGRLPEMKAQFGTFTKESYEGNPLLNLWTTTREEMHSYITGDRSISQRRQ